MAIGFGTVSTDRINQELGRGSTEYLEPCNPRFYARFLNDASGYSPIRSGNSCGSQQFCSWWGYDGAAGRPYIYLFAQEINADCSIRFYKWNPYGVNEWAELWYYVNTGPWTYVEQNGIPARVNDRVQVLWNWFGWGSSGVRTYKAVYSPQRGTFINWGCDPVGNQRVSEFAPISGESIYVYAVESYC
jgi:hypothetical protein